MRSYRMIIAIAVLVLSVVVNSYSRQQVVFSGKTECFTVVDAKMYQTKFFGYTFDPVEHWVTDDGREFPSRNVLFGHYLYSGENNQGHRLFCGRVSAFVSVQAQ